MWERQEREFSGKYRLQQAQLRPRVGHAGEVGREAILGSHFELWKLPATSSLLSEAGNSWKVMNLVHPKSALHTKVRVTPAS